MCCIPRRGHCHITIFDTLYCTQYSWVQFTVIIYNIIFYPFTGEYNLKVEFQFVVLIVRVQFPIFAIKYILINKNINIILVLINYNNHIYILYKNYIYKLRIFINL
jgi:hypothetical protein